MTELKVLTADEQVANILAADARRVRRLTWLAAGLWALVTVVLGYSLAFVGEESRNVRELLRINQGPLQQAMLADQPLDRNEMYLFVNRAIVHALMSHERAVLLTVAAIVVALAAMANVPLVYASRRATLRQIQASLAAIAGQLAEVQRGRGTIPPTAGG